MKNILFYISRYPGYGGIEKVTTILANYWSKVIGWKVYILSVQAQDLNLLSELDKDIKVYFLPKPHEISSSENIDLLNQIITNNNIDWIIYQDSYAKTEDLLYAVKGKCKIAICEHNLPGCISKQDYLNWKTQKVKTVIDFIHKFTYFRHRLKVKSWERNRRCKLYKLCDKYILLSKNYIPLFENITKIEKGEKLTWINNPTTNNTINVRKTEVKKNFIYIGRLDNQKGISHLLHIWKGIEFQHPEWSLRIIGDGVKRKEIEDFIKKNHLSRIFIEGFHPNINEYIDNASILLMTSIYEGWPLVLFETMGRGIVPIIFNSFDSAHEIIDNYKNGILVEPFNINLYIKEIETLMNNNELLLYMSNNAINKAKDNHISNINKKWIEILK